MSSQGIFIRQDIRKSVRFVMFETGYEYWRYATHGGTAFIVSYFRKYYGVTCSHVRKDFDFSKIVLTNLKFGDMVAGISAIYYPTRASGAALDAEMLDIAVIEFSEDASASFFNDQAYIIDTNTIATSSMKDSLVVCGSLKDPSIIDEDVIKPVFSVFECADGGFSKNDITRRYAEARYNNPEINTLTGISGSPVFNVTKNALCGVVTRAGINDGHANFHYVDIYDIDKIIHSIRFDQSETSYQKFVNHRDIQK